MTYRQLLTRLGKDLDWKELDQEVVTFNAESHSYHPVISISEVADPQCDSCVEGQVVLNIGDL
jgi:hypothetical protein